MFYALCSITWHKPLEPSVYTELSVIPAPLADRRFHSRAIDWLPDDYSAQYGRDLGQLTDIHVAREFDDNAEISPTIIVFS